MAIHTILFTLYAFLLVSGATGEKYEWNCSDEFCQNIPCPEPPKECRNRSESVLIVPSLEPCNCCEHCFLLQKEGEVCDKTMAGIVLPRYICGPGLVCNEAEHCEKMTTEDRYFFKNYVCEGQKCYCAVLLPTGDIKKIFGSFDKSSIEKNKKQCLCSVLAYKAMTQTLRALPFENVYQPSARCLENGQFDPLQCIDDICGCVEADTGTPDENGFIYSLEALEENHPRCYNSYDVCKTFGILPNQTWGKPRKTRARHRRGYYTPCEKKRNQLIKEINEEFWKGKHFIHFKKINCNPDGTYVKL